LLGGSFDHPPDKQIDRAVQPIRGSEDGAEQKLEITKHKISPSGLGASQSGSLLPQTDTPGFLHEAADARRKKLPDA
jgi:hypothetical protein